MPPAGFDRLAPVYDLMEWMLAGRLLMRVRTAFLNEWPEQGSVLLAGEGHGKFLLHLCRHRPGLNVTCVDESAAMLAEARRKLQESGVDGRNVTFVQGDLRSCPLESYNVICTQFFLDCFEGRELHQLIARFSAAACPNAQWFLADFRIPESGLVRLRAKLIIFAMYRFFRVATELPASRLEDPLPLLREHGFGVCGNRHWSWGLLHAAWLRRGLPPGSS